MSLLTLDIEKAIAGGRMMARHHGRVVFVAGAIPGERVTAAVVRTEKRVIFADTVEVLSASSDRRSVQWDTRCGGSVFAHIAYARQLTLKAEIIQDGFRRIGRLPIPLPPIVGSPEHGYRMRARFHARGSRLGFYLEGTHALCDAAITSQLLPSTIEWVARVQSLIDTNRLTGVVAIEVAENRAGDRRACHVDLFEGGDPRPFAVLSEGVDGISTRRGDEPAVTLAGTPLVTDAVDVGNGNRVDLTRSPRSFFQSNRYLVEPLVRHVIERAREGPVFDLYAGVGLFGLSVASAQPGPVTLVEGDAASGADLERNAKVFGDRVSLRRQSVEAFLGMQVERLADTTVIVDPPRTGLSKEAIGRLIGLGPARIVYVSCDVATLARDARVLTDAGHPLQELTGIDLFPNTAHVESVAVFSRQDAGRRQGATPDS